MAPMLAGYVNAIARDLSQADREKAVEEAIEKAVDKIDRYEEMRGSFPAWVRAFVRHAVGDLRRRQLSGSFDVTLDNLPDLSALSESSSSATSGELGALSRAFADISPTDQLILGLRYGEQLTHAEIANLLGVNEAASRKRAGRALRRLREAAANESVLAERMERGA
jgi:RNA polymerase sigma-70 factor (ECF subfamily)